MRDALRRLRGHMDRDAVLAATSAEIGRVLPDSEVTIWLTPRAVRPYRIFPVASDEREEVPRAVFVCIRRRKLSRDRSMEKVAAPMATPSSGLLGVVVVSGEIDDMAASMIEEFAHELGFALETIAVNQRALEQRDRSDAVLSRVADSVVVTDSKGKVEQFNDSAVEVLGLDARFAVNKSCATTLGLRLGDEPLDCSSGCALLRLTSSSSLGFELSRTLPDGRVQPLFGAASAVTASNGSVAEVVHSFRDISKLKEADEAKTMFLATASHELKTPLTVIRGFSEMLLADDDGSEENRSAREAIARRAVELNDIVDRILLSSRIEAGRIHVVVRPCEIPQLVQERAEAFAGATGREIVTTFAKDLPSVLADPASLGSVLDHLIENAVKYSPDAGSTFVSIDSDESQVVIRVRDEGIGMSSEQEARCFEKFFQGESSDVRRFGGTGIGLYIVKSLVEGMGGTVEVKSTLGRGSTFTIRLRRADVAPESAALAHSDLPTNPERSVIREFMRQIGVPSGGVRP